MVFLYPGFTAEIGEAEERICWEVCKREVTWSCSSWSIYCLSQIFFMGSRRDLNEVLGWKLNWEAVPYAGEDGIKEWTVWQLDFDSWWVFFTGECEPPPLLCRLLRIHGQACRGSLLTSLSLCWEQLDGNHAGSFSSCLWTLHGARTEGAVLSCFTVLGL